MDNEVGRIFGEPIVEPLQMHKGLQRHLKAQGYVFPKERSQIAEAVDLVSGQPRAKTFRKLLAGDDADKLYSFPKTLPEAHLVMSLQGWESLGCYSAILEAFPELTGKGGKRLAYERIAELGCWTGAFAAFVARKCPWSTVVGFDHADRAIKLGKKIYDLPNLELRVMDYEDDVYSETGDLEQFSFIIGSLALPSPLAWEDNYVILPGVLPQDLCKIAILDELKQNCKPFFKGAEALASASASLVVTARVNRTLELVGLVRAAESQGWEFDPISSKRFYFKDNFSPSKVSAFPLLVFQFADENVNAIDYEELAIWWARETESFGASPAFDSNLALGGYLALPKRKMQERGQFAHTIENISMWVEKGTYSGGAYRLSAFPAGQYSLSLFEDKKAASKIPLEPYDPDNEEDSFFWTRWK